MISIGNSGFWLRNVEILMIKISEVVVLIILVISMFCLFMWFIIDMLIKVVIIDIRLLFIFVIRVVLCVNLEFVRIVVL